MFQCLLLLIPPSKILTKLQYDLFNPENHRSLIKQAMDHITQMTGGCIKFKERTIESDYVYMYQSQG